MNILFCLLLLTPFQSKSAYKSFYKEGEDLLEQQAYGQALDKFKEAFRLKKEADRYRDEGAFFINYMPRYKIALCLEQTDLMAAEEWVDRSKEALESSILKKQKDALATYHRDIERISNAITQKKEALNAEYELKLKQADDLLARNRFKEARTAYEALYRMNPKRPEANVGLGRIGPTRENYLKSLALSGRTAALEQRFSEAETIAARIADIDPNSRDLETLRNAIKSSRAALEEEKRKAEQAATVVQNTPPKKPETKPEQKKTESRPTKRPDTRALDKKALKTSLLATLKPYRRGDPAAALSKLNEIDAALAKDSASYYWLKTLYLLAQWKYADQADQKLLNGAREAFAKTRTLQPDFHPSDKLYPDYVLAFVAENQP